MTELTFVNYHDAKCGCGCNFSDGEGEYSDVIRITLCPIHDRGAECLKVKETVISFSQHGLEQFIKEMLSDNTVTWSHTTVHDDVTLTIPGNKAKLRRRLRHWINKREETDDATD